MDVVKELRSVWSRDFSFCFDSYSLFYCKRNRAQALSGERPQLRSRKAGDGAPHPERTAGLAVAWGESCLTVVCYVVTVRIRRLIKG